jgi:Skp family chaperone for outer membrane proteins
MLFRICLVLTIVAGLTTAYVGFFPVQDIIKTTRAARDDYHTKLDAETALYQKTDKELKKTKNELASTTAKLTETTAQLEAANAKITDLDKQTADLTDKLNKTTARAETAEQTLEKWRQLPPPEEIKNIITELASTKKARDAIMAENKILLAARKDLQKRLDDLIGTDVAVILPEGLKGTITAVDPKYDFVVLNIGDDQGVKERGELMVNRKGRLIGKVRITSVQKDSSVASIMPSWKRGQIIEGDQVLY